MTNNQNEALWMDLAKIINNNNGVGKEWNNIYKVDVKHIPEKNCLELEKGCIKIVPRVSRGLSIMKIIIREKDFKE